MLHYPISNLHYGLYHTLLRLSRVFWIFYGRGLISMGRNKRQQNKKPLQACLSFLSLEERYRSQQSFLVVRTLICFQQASSLFPELSNNVEQTITGGARCQNRTALLVPKTSVLPLHFILHINGAPCRNRTHFWCLQNNCSNHWANGAYTLYEPYVHSAFIEPVVPISESSSGNYLSCRNYQALPLALRMRVELMLLPWKSSVLTAWPTEHINVAEPLATSWIVSKTQLSHSLSTPTKSLKLPHFTSPYVLYP